MVFFLYLSTAITLVGFVYSARSLRRMLYLIFFFSLIEGVYINYYYPSQVPLVLKDALIAWSYALLVFRGKLREALRRLGPPALPIALYSAIYVLHAFNPELNSVLVGVVGLRVAVFYLPLALVALVAFDREDEVWHFLRFCLALTAPVCLYGVLQYFGGSAHVAALGPGYVRRGVALLWGGGTSGYSFRTLSTFTYSSSFSNFILLMVPFAWTAVGAQRSRQWKLLTVAVVLLLFAAQISSGGRQALIFTALAMALTEIFYQRGVLPRIAAPLVITLGVVLGFFVLGQEKLQRYETILDVEQVRWRYETYFIHNNLYALETSPLGHGAGAASPAARHVGVTRFTISETAFAKLAYEVGIPGILAYFWMLGSMIASARRALRRAVSRRMVLYGRAFLSLALMTFATSFNGWPLDVPPASSLFWVFGGLALVGPHLQVDEAVPLAPPPDDVPEPAPAADVPTPPLVSVA